MAVSNNAYSNLVAQYCELMVSHGNLLRAVELMRNNKITYSGPQLSTLDLMIRRAKDLNSTERKTA